MKKRKKQRIISVITIVCMVLTMFNGITLTVKAATNTNVSNETELRAAITGATNGDTINVTSDIVVTSAITINNKSIIIEGNNHTIKVPVTGLDESGIPNTNPSRYIVLTVSAPAQTVQINNMTVKAGAAEGILNNSGTILKLTNINISNSNNSAGGGGIINSGGTVYLKNSNISRNAAYYGGGFLNSGSMFIEDSTFSENRSTSGSGGGGAGENQGYLYANNSTFSNNKSTELGGAINNHGGTSYFVNSTFTGNVAYGSLSGGAIANNGGTVKTINSLFAYNYRNSGSTSAPIYILNDVYAYSGSLINSYYCIFQDSTYGTNLSTNLGNTLYSALADGSNNSIFTNGVNAKILDANGVSLGTATVFQPLLAKLGGTTTSALLKTASDVLGKGVRTSFTNGNGTPSIGYYDGTQWVSIVGTATGSNEVTGDQNTSARLTPTVGSVSTTTSEIYLLKVNAATGGTVVGGTVYGDAYAKNSNINLTAIPSSGYAFSYWQYIDGGTGTVADNPYALTITQNTTINPVFITSSKFAVTYVGSGNTAGTVPVSGSYDLGATVTVGSAGTLVKDGYSFTGWNTSAAGSGTDYAAGSTFAISANTILYAKWTPATYSVTYDGNGSTGGTVPTANSYVSGYSVTVGSLGTLVKPDYNFVGWNTAADGSGTSYAANSVFSVGTTNVTLYAKWVLSDAIFAADNTGVTNTDVNVTINYPSSSTVKKYSLDGTNYSDYTTPITFHSNGTIYAKAQDSAGNWSNVSQYNVINIDKTAPSFSVSGNPSTWTNSNVILSISASDVGLGLNASGAYSFDGGSNWTTSNTKGFSLNGTVNIEVRDSAGNISSQNIVIDKIDKVAPTFSSITQTPTVWTSGGVALIVNGATDNSGSGLNAAAYSFSTEQGVYNWQSSNISSTFTQNQVIYVYLRDALGNVNNYSIVNIANIDKTLPTIASVTGNPTDWTSSDVTLAISASDEAGGSGLNTAGAYSFDGGSTWSTSNTMSFSSNTTASIKVKDNAGNIATYGTIDITKIDKVAPNIAVIANNDKYTENNWFNQTQTITASFTNTPGCDEKLQYKVDASAWTDGASVGLSTEGKYIVSFRVIDYLGRTSAVQTAFVNIDKTAPTTAKITIKDNSFTTFLNTITFGLFFKETVGVTITADSNISGVSKIEYQKVSSVADYNSAGTWTEGNSFNVNPDEKFIVYAKITDNAGNYVIINSDGVIVDATRPTLILTPDANDWTKNNVNVNIVVSDNLAGVKEVNYTTDEATPQSGTVAITDGKGTITLTNEGQYNLTVTAKDNSLNVISESVNIKINRNLLLHDAKTDLTVTSIDGTIFTPDVYLVVTPINGNTNEAKFSSASKNVESVVKYIPAIAGKELLALYDVSLFKESVKIQPDGNVKVKIKIPQELKNRTGFDIVHIADDGTVTSMNAIVEGDYLVFITNHFSDYAIVAKTIAITKELPKTGSVVDSYSLIFGGIFLSLLGMILIRKQSRKSKKA